MEGGNKVIGLVLEVSAQKISSFSLIYSQFEHRSCVPNKAAQRRQTNSLFAKSSPGQRKNGGALW